MHVRSEHHRRNQIPQRNPHPLLPGVAVGGRPVVETHQGGNLDLVQHAFWDLSKAHGQTPTAAQRGPQQLRLLTNLDTQQASTTNVVSRGCRTGYGALVHGEGTSSILYRPQLLCCTTPKVVKDQRLQVGEEATLSWRPRPGATSANGNLCLRVFLPAQSWSDPLQGALGFKEGMRINN